MNKRESLMVYSIFLSIDGEVNLYGQGGFATFVRLAGCNLKCMWCDTPYAGDYKDGNEMFLDEIIDRIESFGCKKITITGGEPLFQPNALKYLCQELWHKGYKMTVETNGSLVPNGLYGVSSWVVDYKLPSSGMMKEMQPDETFLNLTTSDYIKFVIATKKDYDQAKTTLIRWDNKRGVHAKIVFSPFLEKLDVKQLISWMKEDELFGIILNLQLHKLVDFGENK